MRTEPESSSATAISIHDFDVDYYTEKGVFPALRDVSFDLTPGERLAVVGESGSGKSTLAFALTGMLPADQAAVSWSEAQIAGRPVDMRPSRLPIPVRRAGVSMIFQDAMTSLDPVATIGHQFRTVMVGAGVSKRDIRAQAIAWIGKVGIPSPERVLKLHPYELSGGMRQRVMIALALCNRPRLLLADEPTSALDATVSRVVMQLLLDLTDQLGTALIIITHDIDLARAFTDKVLVLFRGEVADYCRTDRLGSEERSAYTRALIRCVPRLQDHARAELPTLASVTRQMETELRERAA